MAKPNAPLEGANFKVGRARVHIEELARDIDAYRQTKPYSLKPDPYEIKSGDAVQITLPETIPPILAVIAGDVLHNLRSALDHLVCKLAIRNGSSTCTGVSFPFAKNASLFEEEAARKIKPLSLEAQQFIKGLRPYEDGNHLLWTLHRLNIIDKHRLLVLVGSTVSVEIAQESEPYRFIDLDLGAAGLRTVPLFKSVAQFSFDVSLREPVEFTEPITTTFSNMADLVSTILADAEARFFSG